MHAWAPGERVSLMAVPGDGHRGDVATMPCTVQQAGLAIFLWLPKRLLLDRWQDHLIGEVIEQRPDLRGSIIGSGLVRLPGWDHR
jgi:hypothetical protein